MSAKDPLYLYYHEPSDALGIANPAWGYILTCKWLPIVRRHIDSDGQWAVNAKDPIEFVEHPIANEMSEDWHIIGEF